MPRAGAFCPDFAPAKSKLGSSLAIGLVLALGSCRPAEVRAPPPEARADSTPQNRSEDAVEEPRVLPEGTEPLNDGFDTAEPPIDGKRPPHPLAHLTEAELEKLLVDEPASLGSMSIGRPSGGKLFNGVRMKDAEHWTVVDPANAWGTEETIHYLSTAIEAVNEKYPASPKLSIGHISAKDGGYLKPHMSHQTGRDVDISYYYRSDGRWYKRAHAKNLDVERSWAFVKALVVKTDVELILIDHSIQRLLRNHAEETGDDEGWLDSLFKGKGSLRPIIRHARGHRTHMHIRFYNPIAQETARRCVPLLVKHEIIEKPKYYVNHLVRKGETLGKLAKRYGTTVREIQRANGLKSTLIQAKRRYRIPQDGPAPSASKPVVIPKRRLPPEP